MARATGYAAERAAASADQSSRRTAALAVVAGFLAFGTLGLNAWYYRREDHHKTNERRDERFSKAIEHLSDDGKEGVQVGGIYTLEALVVEDPQRAETIGQILVSFTHEWRQAAIAASDVGLEVPTPSRPVRAADAVCARIRQEGTTRELDLRHADLRHEVMEGAYLYRAKLQNADLRHARLADADLHRVNFTDANLSDANLAGAIVTATTWYGARITRADLQGAILSRRFVASDYLMDADTDADLTGVLGWGTHPSHEQHRGPAR